MTAIDTQRTGLELESAAQDLLFREARTANTFTDEPVGDEQLAAIYDLIKWAPTSMNIQPLRIVAVRSDEAKARLLPLVAEGNRPKTEVAPLTVILAADTDFHDHLHKTFPHKENAREFFLDDDRRTETARFNASLQVAYFILGVRAAGLAAGPMTGFDAAGVDKEFFGGENVQSLALVNIGKPGHDAWFGRSPRLESEHVVRTV
jgi:3-hydroxypropanoate dehydrogenase